MKNNSINTAIVAKANDYPVALAGGVLAAKENLPLLLV